MNTEILADNDGTVLNISTADTSGNDPTLTPTMAAADPSVVARPQMNISPEKIMGMIKKWIKDETITKEQALQMRRQFGISQSYFTGKRSSRDKRKRMRKIVKNSRRINRHNGSTKGQKMTGGINKK